MCIVNWRASDFFFFTFYFEFCFYVMLSHWVQTFQFPYLHFTRKFEMFWHLTIAWHCTFWMFLLFSFSIIIRLFLCADCICLSLFQFLTFIFEYICLPVWCNELCPFLNLSYSLSSHMLIYLPTVTVSSFSCFSVCLSTCLFFAIFLHIQFLFICCKGPHPT